MLEEDIWSGKLSSKLQVGIGDRAGGVGRGNQAGKHVRGERGAPENGREGGISREPNTAHTLPGSVSGTVCHRESIHDFTNTGGAMGKIMCKVL